jgi:Ca2+-binding RTX toxin-like protein
MRTVARTARIVLATGLLLLGIGAQARAAIAPGDLVVADPTAQALIKVDPATGQQSLISNNAISAENLFEAPYGVALELGGTLLVADADGPPPGNSGALIRVDPDTGQQGLVSSNAKSGLDLFEDPRGVVVTPAGEVYVSDSNADGGTGAVIRVDLATGQQTLAAANLLPTTDLFDEPAGIAREAGGDLVVADLDSPPGPAEDGAIVGIDPGTGVQTLVSSNATSTLDLFYNPAGVAVEASKNLLVANAGADPSGSGIVRVSRSTGEQSAIALGGEFVQPWGIALDPDRRALVSDQQAFVDGGGGVIQVNPSTGSRTTISSNSVSPPGLLEDPAGLLVVPPTCLGKYATIVGTDNTDTLTGTADADVMVARGGNDIVQGKAGADLICGGSGRNRLVGDDGRDRFLGGAGPDVILGNDAKDTADGETGADKIDGGSGKDRLTGNKGRDNLVGGKAADKLFGNAKRDKLTGSKGNDLLKGGFGADKLFGGSGRDRLRGGPGRDKQKQ